MAFIRKKVKTFKWPVNVEEPSDGGTFETTTFDAVFKRLPQTRIREIWDLIQAGELNDDELCAEVLTGWKGSQDAKGEEVRFSEKAKADLLNVPLVAAAVVTAWLESLAKGKRKN